MSDLSISRARAFNKEINTAHPYLHISTWLVSLKIDSSEKDLSRLLWQFRSSDKISFNTSHLSFSLTHTHICRDFGPFLLSVCQFFPTSCSRCLLLSASLGWNLSHLHPFLMMGHPQFEESACIIIIDILSIYYPISIQNWKRWSCLLVR